MTTKQRYHRELEEGIAKAKVWREVVIVTANDGAGCAAPVERRPGLSPAGGSLPVFYLSQ